MVKLVIFDAFGLIYPEWGDFIKGKAPRENQEKLQQLFRDFDLGHVSLENYDKNLSALTGTSIKELQATRYENLKANQEVLSLVSRIQPGFHKAVLSNTHDGYFQNLVKRDKLDSKFDEIFTSHKLSVMKPSPEAYLQVLSFFDYQPEEAAFFDDRKSNVAAASELGIKGFHFTNERQMARDLMSIGVIK